MKKVVRLLSSKSRKTRNATQYDEFVDGNSGTRNDESRERERERVVVPTVHNYGKTKGKLKSKVQQLQRQSKRRQLPANDNSINYASLDRKRNDNDNDSDLSKSYSNKNISSTRDVQRIKLQHRQQFPQRPPINRRRKGCWSKNFKYKWRRLLSCLKCSQCCRNRRTYKPSKASTMQGGGGNSNNKTQQHQRRRFNCCNWQWQHWRICGGNSYQYNSADDDDDIDGKVAAFLFEMKQREAATTAPASSVSASTSATTSNVAPTVQNQSTQLQCKNTNESCTRLIPTTAPQMRSGKENTTNTTTTTTASTASTSTTVDATASTALIFRRRSQSQCKQQRRAWTWDDSLRSNSDRFLETLEEDDPCVWPLPSVCNSARRPPLKFACVVDFNGTQGACNFVGLNGNGEEAKAAAEELSRSPVIGQRHDPASSPLQSRGSTSSDAWPIQSDEDIDRLVAMHQNRSSLSSLGLRSDSMASVYSGAGEGRYGTVVVKGQVEFGMQYNYKLSALEIHVVRCKDLAAVDAKRNRSDPYVKVYLLPDKSKAGKRKTKVKKHTLNPIFDEVLRFHVPISSLESRTLWLTVWHSDMFGRNDFLGEVSVNLQGRVFDNPQSQWYLLQERSEPFDDVATYRGDIVVGLKYIPPDGTHKSPAGFLRTASISSSSGSSSNLRKFGSIKSVASKADRSAKGGQLHVLVKEAKHLSPIKANGTCDAFCKSYLLPDRTRSSKQKTPVVKRSLNPSWNYTFVYEDVSLEDLSERALELTVWDHDRLASNEFVGGIRFSLGSGKSYGRHVEWMDASGKELSLWQNMLDRPNFWVEGSLPLRSTLDGIRAIP